MTRTRVVVSALVAALLVATVAPAVAVAPNPSQQSDSGLSSRTAGIDGNTSVSRKNRTASDDGTRNVTGPNGAPVTLPGKRAGNPKIASGVLDDGRRTGSVKSAYGSEPSTGDRLRLVVRAKRGHGGAAVDVANRLGTVETRHDDRFVVSLPRAAVETLANSEHVAFVRRPSPRNTFGTVSTEGVDALNATRPHQLGYDGDNVTVAVVDYSFDADAPEIANNVVATENFNAGSGAFDTPNTHGTACVEVVTDAAPNVSVVLVAVGGSGVSMRNALDYLAANDSIDAVSMSVGPLAGAPLDGSSAISQDIDDVVASGKPFFMSAGNEANGDHWNGTWQDGDGDRWLNFTTGDELMGVGRGSVQITFQWRDWPASDQDYDLYLFNSSGSYVAQSTTNQTGSQAPLERLSYAGNADESYYLGVRRANATGNASFNAFVSQGDFEHATAEQSLVLPATGERVTAVAAVDAYSRNVEAFSSRGPTVDGRLKPTLAAPDNVSTSVYDSFYGTSAAAPHAAGAAALLLDANPTLEPDAVTTTFEQTARPVTGTEPNVASGYGLIDVNRSIASLSYATVDQCRPIDDSGTFALTGSLTASSSDCLTVSASNVTLDGQGYTIAGANATSVVSITAPHPVSNVSIRDLRVSNGTAGIEIGRNVSEVTLRNVTVDGANTAIASSADGVTIRNLTVSRSGDGVAISSSNGTTVSGATISDVTRALVVTNESHDNTLRNITALNATEWTYYAGPTTGVNRVENLTVGDNQTVTFSGEDVAVADAPPLTSADTPGGRRVVGSTFNVTNTSTGAWASLNATYDRSAVSDEQSVALWHHDAGWARVENSTQYASASPPTVGANVTDFSAFAVLADLEPRVAFEADTVRYGDVLLNHSAEQTIPLSNTGSAALNVTNVSIEGPQADAYTLSAPVTPFTVSPNATRDLRVTVSANSTGWANATLRVAHNDTDRNVSRIDLTTHVVDEPRAALSNTVEYGGVHVGNSSVRNVTVTNTGTEPLDISNVTVDGTAAGDYRLLTEPSGTVAVNESRNVSVVFEPTTVGAADATLAVAHNGSGGGTSTVALAGIGVGSRIDVTPTEVSRSGLSKGTTKSYAIAIQNTGNAPLTVESVGFATETSSFSLSTTGPFTVAAGDQREVTVTFDASTTGTHDATVVIAHNATGSASPTKVTYSLSVAAPSNDDGDSETTVTQSPSPAGDGGSSNEPARTQQTTTKPTGNESSTTEQRVQVTTDGRVVRVTVSQVGSNGATDVEFPASSPLERLTVAVDDTDSFTATVDATRAKPSNVPPIDARSRDVLHYLNVSHPTLPSTQISGATLVVRISKDQLTAANASVSDVSVYRYDEDWTALDTTVVNETESAYFVRADSPGLSVFAVTFEKSAYRQSTTTLTPTSTNTTSTESTETTTLTESTTATNSVTETETTTKRHTTTSSRQTDGTSGGSPGFGVGLSVLALLASAFFLRRR